MTFLLGARPPDLPRDISRTVLVKEGGVVSRVMGTWTLNGARRVDALRSVIRF